MARRRSAKTARRKVSQTSKSSISSVKTNKLTVTQKFNSMKRQAEEAGMRVYEEDGKLKVVKTKKFRKK